MNSFRSIQIANKNAGWTVVVKNGKPSRFVQWFCWPYAYQDTLDLTQAEIEEAIKGVRDAAHEDVSHGASR